MLFTKPNEPCALLGRRYKVRTSLYQKCTDEQRLDLLSEWNSEKNTSRTPETVSYGSHWRAWWRCEAGHEWQAAVYSRWEGRGCPYCSGLKVLKGVNDFASLFPELALQWHPTKNGVIRPEDVTAKSTKVVWWLCEKGHEWKTSVCGRSKGHGCPVCNNRSLLPGYNDLATANPALAAQWHPVKNGVLSATQVFPGSKKRVWWQCEKGHEWQAVINDRMHSGCGCPYCANKQILTGFNDLATTEPEISAQWDGELNGRLTPQMLSKGSGKKVWWRCANGHVWRAAVYSRTGIERTGCPICAGATSEKRLKRMRRLAERARDKQTEAPNAPSRVHYPIHE